MKQLEIVKNAMKLFKGSFINTNNELILIPKFNVYILLDDIETELDVKVKLCEWFSRDCCCSLRYSTEKRNSKYWEDNTEIFNELCGTQCSVDDMASIYSVFGNGINRELCREFVLNGFKLKGV